MPSTSRNQSARRAWASRPGEAAAESHAADRIAAKRGQGFHFLEFSAKVQSWQGSIMIVIGTDLAETYFADHAGDKGIKAARGQYDSWLAIASRAEWRTPQDIKVSHPKASILKSGRVVFNIKGNDYRLIAVVRYKAGVLVIRFFGTHADYDKINAEAIQWTQP
jgi:mRNA interferase HigB